MSAVEKPKTKVSETIQTGYMCGNCFAENVSKGMEVLTPVCLNCGQAKLTKKWQYKIKTVTTIESV